MNWNAVAAVAAIAGVVATVLGGMALLIWNAGRHSQRLDAAEDDITELQKGAKEASRFDTALQVLTTTVTAVQGEVSEIRHDVKNMLTGKVQPARRQRSGD